MRKVCRSLAIVENYIGHRELGSHWKVATEFITQFNWICRLGWRSWGPVVVGHKTNLCKKSQNVWSLAANDWLDLIT